MFVFIETRLFTRLVDDYLSDLQLAELQGYLLDHPEAGDLIRGSGGVRKLRWSGSGRGKRGGLRVIYYLMSQHDEIWLLTLYAKNEAEDIPTAMLRRIREEIDASH